MPTQSYAEILARHSGPFALVTWKRPADPRANKGLPLKYLSRTDDPVTDARTAIAGGASSVDLWSMSEQQFVTTFRPNDVGDAPLRPEAIVAPPTRKARGGEYRVAAATDSSSLPPTLFLTFEAFRERGAATVAEIAKDLGRETDPIASHATRLKNMGFLERTNE